MERQAFGSRGPLENLSGARQKTDPLTTISMEAHMAAKRYPLPKRFNAALSEKACARLRDINAVTGFGNNYCLAVVLENLDEVVATKKLD
ncbi:MAG: hypothetical protein P8L79_13370 [Rhodospirillaceae bacterium]|jgi:hypothetical protein|nr:hypothetical protein [Rhodospirillaceae bacterium]